MTLPRIRRGRNWFTSLCVDDESLLFTRLLEIVSFVVACPVLLLRRDHRRAPADGRPLN